MPLVRDGSLHAWDRLQAEGWEILSPAQAEQSSLPMLHIGFLNMMPDRALDATERQFFRLLAAGASDCMIFLHPFTIPGLGRGADALDYVSRNYVKFVDIRATVLDGLVLTGANPVSPDLTKEKYWPEFKQIVDWANRSVPSIMCSCLASHAVLNIFHGIERTRCVPGKRWGVFSHRLLDFENPLTTGIKERFDAPRSHVFEMTAKQLRQHGIVVLASSPEADFEIATSSDGFQWIFLQGHPEYDSISLLKEYKREISRYLSGERNDYPEPPKYYLDDSANLILNEYRELLMQAVNRKESLPDFPESEIAVSVRNTWKEYGFILFRNWLVMLVEHAQSSDREPSRQSSA